MQPVLIVKAKDVQTEDQMLGTLHGWGKFPIEVFRVIRATRNGNDRSSRKITFVGSSLPIVLDNDALVAIVRES